jgi:hypothetical protein
MISQEIEQAELFRTHPEEEQVAFAVAARAASELANLCAQDGATPVFAWLPPVSVGQPRVFGDEVERCLDVLGVRPAGLAVSERLGARWLDHLEQEGLASVDLRPILAAQDEPCYWSFDRHLNVRGHAVVAEALLPALRAALE